jgi:hypothetical protein
MATPFVFFVALASPLAFKTTRGILGGSIAGPEGLPKLPGLLLHALVFVLIMKSLRKSNYETADDQDDQNTKRYQDGRFIFDGTI